MQVYQRYIRPSETASDLLDEQSEFLAALKAAPGIKHSEFSGVHPKGGYLVRVE